MCLVFISVAAMAKGPLMVGANREEVAPASRDVARMLPSSAGCAACSPAPIMAPTARSPRWEPGWASTRPAWPWRSPTAMTASLPGPIRFVREDCSP